MSFSNPLIADFPSFSPKLTHYQILGVILSSTPEEIKAAYDELILSLLTITFTSAEKKKREELTNAYIILSDPVTRRTYDESLALNTATSTTAAASGTVSITNHEVTSTITTPITTIMPCKHRGLPAGFTASPLVAAEIGGGIGNSGNSNRGRKRSMTVVSIPSAKRVAGDFSVAWGLGEIFEEVGRGEEGWSETERRRRRMAMRMILSVERRFLS